MAGDIRNVKSSLVLKIEDFETGIALDVNDVFVTADGGIRSPIFKKEGYFVFTGSFPKDIVVCSKRYEQVVLSPKPGFGGVYRVALIPFYAQGKVLKKEWPPYTEAYVGFSGKRMGYALCANVTSGLREIVLHKNDTSDITCMWHVLREHHEESGPEPIFIERNKGYGKYLLFYPVKGEYTAPRCRLIPMRRVFGNMDGILNIPLPSDAGTMYIMESEAGDVGEIELEGK